MVLLSVALDFALEHRANRAARTLEASVSLRAQVVREGQPRSVPVAEVVPGDMVLLSAGDRVRVDGRFRHRTAAGAQCGVHGQLRSAAARGW